MAEKQFESRGESSASSEPGANGLKNIDVVDLWRLNRERPLKLDLNPAPLDGILSASPIEQTANLSRSTWDDMKLKAVPRPLGDLSDFISDKGGIKVMRSADGSQHLSVGLGRYPSEPEVKVGAEHNAQQLRSPFARGLYLQYRAGF